MGRESYWPEYVPVARRRANAKQFAEKVRKKEKRTLQPVVITGRAIASTFWGKAWCENLERYSDYANRLPRGRTYVRNGSVVDLQISTGCIDAFVAGSEVYTVQVTISKLQKNPWQRIKSDCSKSIDSLMDLLGGRFSKGVMDRLTQQKDGLFPQPSEIRLSCSCPDSAVLCKHVAAVMYGVGSHLDHRPELLFVLRGVDHAELIDAAIGDSNLDSVLTGTDSGLAGEDLSELFGIEIDGEAERQSAVGSKSKPKPKSKRDSTRRVAKATTLSESNPSQPAKSTTATKARKKTASRTSPKRPSRAAQRKATDTAESVEPTVVATPAKRTTKKKARTSKAKPKNSTVKTSTVMAAKAGKKKVTTFETLETSQNPPITKATKKKSAARVKAVASRKRKTTSKRKTTGT